MKNKKMKSGGLLTLAFLMAAGNVMPALAGSWQQDAAGWRWKNDDGSYHAGSWQWLDGNRDGVSECYYFAPNGYMLANTVTPDGFQVNTEGAWVENGTVKTMGTPETVTVPEGRWVKGDGVNAGKWWWLNPNGSYPIHTWRWLDGNQDGVAECYYFDDNGWAVTSGLTPDGFLVNAEGAWVENQVVKTKKATRGGGGPAGVGGGTSGKTGSGGGGSSSGGGSHGGSHRYEDDDDDEWDDYADGSVSGSANDFKTANFGMMTSSQWKETKAAIEKFKQEYITDGMSDMEKEIKIIEWLVQNCRYQSKSDWSRSTAYSCIILGKAQCAGYADAFLQTAKLCGLDARYIHNSSHAWNLVKLDGDWYHVDVTWEDPIGGNSYGFGNLRNKYINLTDDKIRNERSHKTWSPNSLKATGTKYGPEAVKEYLISQKPDHLVTTEYQIKYVDENGRVLNVVKGTGRAGTTVTPKKKTFEGYELDQEITPFTLNKISSQNVFEVRYARYYNFTIVYLCTTDDKVLSQSKGRVKNGSIITTPVEKFDGHTLESNPDPRFTVDKDVKVFVYYTHETGETEKPDGTENAGKEEKIEETETTEKKEETEETITETEEKKENVENEAGNPAE